MYASLIQELGIFWEGNLPRMWTISYNRKRSGELIARKYFRFPVTGTTGASDVSHIFLVPTRALEYNGLNNVQKRRPPPLKNRKLANGFGEFQRLPWEYWNTRTCRIFTFVIAKFQVENL